MQRHTTTKSITALFSLSVFVLLGLGSGDTEADAPRVVPSSSSSSPNGSAAPTEEKKPDPPTVFHLAETIAVGPFEVTLEEVKTKRSVKDGFMKHKAGDGAELLLAKVKVSNVGKEQKMLLDNFSIVDSQERVFETTSECTMATKGALSFEQINPGLSKTGWVCFEVPKELPGKLLRFEPTWLSTPILIALEKKKEPADKEAPKDVKEEQPK